MYVIFIFLLTFVVGFMSVIMRDRIDGGFFFLSSLLLLFIAWPFSLINIRPLRFFFSKCYVSYLRHTHTRTRLHGNTYTQPLPTFTCWRFSCMIGNRLSTWIGHEQQRAKAYVYSHHHRVTRYESLVMLVFCGCGCCWLFCPSTGRSVLLSV